MEIDIKTMFQSIKDSMKDEKKNTGNYKDILKLKPDNVYILRLVPNMEKPSNTFFHYFHHGWQSLATGQYVDSLCLSTYDERCPICEERFKLSRSTKEADKELAKLINRMEKRMVNVYVVNDPVTPENNGTIKVLRYGTKIHKKIDEAINGSDAEEFGARIFDLSDNGCSFKLKVETAKEGVRQFQNYDNSRFMGAAAIEGMTPEKRKEILETAYDLTKYVESKTRDEMIKLVQTHVYCKIDEEPGVPSNKKSSAPVDEVDDDDNLPGVSAKKPAPAPAPEEKKAAVPEAKSEEAPQTPSPNKEKLSKLLDDLDNI